MPSLDDRLQRLAPTLGLTLEADDRRQLLAYMDLIQRWTRVYNLTAVRDPDEMFTHHLLDCLAVVPSLRRAAESAPGGLRLLDVGSGAGLPGVILALLNPGWQVTCVDAVAKKAAFIRQTAAELHIPNLTSVHARVEAPEGGLAGATFDLITSRAFASIRDFTTLTRPLLASQGRWAAMKARLSPEEEAAVPADVELFHVEPIRVPDLDEKRCLVWLQPRRAGAEGQHEPRQ